MRDDHRGFSLIELMIAVSLGMLAVAAVGSVFIYGSRNYKQDDKVSRMQDELRFAMAQLTQDLEMAGFFAQVRSPLNDIAIDDSATLGSAGDCGPTTDGGASTATNNWYFRERRAHVFTGGDADADGLTGAEANALFPCIAEEEFQPGTDIIAVKRLSGTPATAFTLGRPYLRTNGVETTLYRYTSAGAVPAPSSGQITVYEFRPVVWFIRSYSVSPSESPRVPALCRKALTPGNGKMETDSAGCLAQGIADMQLEFGFDDNIDGVADYFQEYAAAPDVAALSRIVAVRVHLLAQSTQADVGYVNQKTYRLAGTTVGPFNDGYYRRSLSSTVLLRNPANQLLPYSLPSG